MGFLADMASGEVLYWAIGVVAALVLLDVVWKGGAVKTLKLLVTPVTWVWGKLFGKKVVPGAITLSYVAADAAKATNWFTGSRIWRWLAGHSYDPGNKPWTWYIERALGLLVLLLFTHWHAYNVGTRHPKRSHVRPFSLMASPVAKQLTTDLQVQLDKCNSDYADLYTRQPPACGESPAAPLTLPAPAAKHTSKPRSYYKPPPGNWGYDTVTFWLRLIFNNVTGVAVCIVGLLFIGNAYGCNASKLSDIEAGIKERDKELQRLASSAAAAGAREDGRLRDQQAAFKARKVGQCILTKPQADALSLIKG
jgi:hypothetical protein